MHHSVTNIYIIHSIHSFHCHVQYSMIPCHSQELLPFLSVMYSNWPSFSKNVNSTPGILRVVVTGNFNVFRPNNLVY